MNKLKTLITIICISCCFIACKEKSNIIELPIDLVDGFGSFNALYCWYGTGNYKPDVDDLWSKNNLQLVGIPDEWTDVRTGDFRIDNYQLIHQSYHSGLISEKDYEKMKNGYSWWPDSVTLSKEPLKVRVGYAYGKDKDGQMKIVVDANNNLNLSDDPVLDFVKFDMSIADSLSARPIYVKHERLINNQITEVETPLAIAHLDRVDVPYFCFPQHATATLDGSCIEILSRHGYSYKNAELQPPLTISPEEESELGNTIAVNEYLEIGDKIYINKGVDFNKKALILEKVNLPKDQIYGAQISFKAHPIEGKDFTTGKDISLEEYKGKYLFIDFWATSCGACRAKMPELKRMHAALDHSKVEFLGIVCRSPKESVETFLAQQELTWNQIYSDNTNKIMEKYGITYFPTTLLIDPQGVIIAKDLRGEKLEKKLKELNNI